MCVSVACRGYWMPGANPFSLETISAILLKKFSKTFFMSFTQKFLFTNRVLLFQLRISCNKFWWPFLVIYTNWMPPASIWFEIWGSWIRVKKNLIFFQNFDFFRQFHEKFWFSRQIFEKFWLFQAYFWKVSIFSGLFSKFFDFFRQFKNNFNFPGKNSSFTAHSGQIFLFLFKSHHFWIYFLYLIK